MIVSPEWHSGDITLKRALKSTAMVVLLLIVAAPLSGCGGDAAPEKAELAQARQDIADLQDRVKSLDARLQAVEASLPVGERVEPEN